MNIRVEDPFGAGSDPALPTLALALDPEQAYRELKRRLPKLSEGNSRLRLISIRVKRHKPGRRCVIEYDLVPKGKSEPTATVIGKIRAGRFGSDSFRLVDNFWNAGFASDSQDGISVPEPLGVIASFQMWCQRKVPGETAEHALRGNDGSTLARRIAEAAHKLHEAHVPTRRQHTMADELRILKQCLDKTRAYEPEFSARLERIWAECERLGARLPKPQACGIHRDFYPAQVIVDGRRIYLIDFDLYCLGDPGLDIGNFLAHMTEQSLRELGNASAMQAREEQLEDSFVALAGELARAAVRVYAVLSLARHIYLSTQFPERQPFTESLMDLCEQRLSCPDLIPR